MWRGSDAASMCQDRFGHKHQRSRKGRSMTIMTVGIDLAKNVFSVHGVDEMGKVALKRTVRRDQLLELFANLPACVIAMVVEKSFPQSCSCHVDPAISRHRDAAVLRSGGVARAQKQTARYLRAVAQFEFPLSAKSRRSRIPVRTTAPRPKPPLGSVALSVGCASHCRLSHLYRRRSWVDDPGRPLTKKRYSPYRPKGEVR
jgi:hypothetical protein